MKKVALFSLALASSVFALDEYLPIAPNALEVDVGVSHNAPDGPDAYQSIPLAVKYGVMPGLTLELATDYSMQDPGSGLGQPQLAAKYSISAVEGLAVFANVVLPFATGDRADAYKGLGIAPGAVYGKNYGKISAAGLVGYQLNMKDADDIEADNELRVFLKPGYLVNDKLTGYVGIDYKTAGDVNSTKLVPGVTYMHSSTLSFEANLPYVVSESGAGKGWALNASVYYTLGM
jgi:hypothetical protein